MSEMTDMDGWMRDVADAAASLDKRGDRQMSARLMRLHRDMDIALLRGDGEQGKVVATVRHDTGLTITADRLPYYTGTRLPMGAKLYARPRPVAVTGDAVGEALRTDYVLEFITETPADVTHQKLVSLGWTPPAAPCADAGALCIDCTPRNPDGACPDAAPAPVAGDDVGLHVLTGVFDKHGEELRAGDRIVIRIEGEHTKPEYWNPEYVIAWVAPRFTLRHVGGGLDSDTARWYFGLGTDQGYKMLELLDRPATLAQDRASQGAAAGVPDAPPTPQVTDAMAETVGSALFKYWNDVNEECRGKYRERVRAALESALKGT